MSGPCGESEPKKPTRLWRNGMDYEPKKTYPPDYSNVPDVRSWQMSPFSQERFDLDEIERAEKKGIKGKAELERLKKLYLGGPKEEKDDKCAKCIGKKHPEPSEPKVMKCHPGPLYQPYGPSVVSAMSYSRPEFNKPRMYSYMGPSILSGFGFKRGSSGEGVPVPCENFEIKPTKRDFGNVYVPYGPLGEIRITKDQYVPMGPSIIPNRR